MEDQFEKKLTERKERVAKNQKNQQKNLERAEKITKANGGGKILKDQKKKQLASALRTTKTATASLGKFDPKLKNEPKMKSLGKKNKFDPVVLGTDVEKKKSLGVLDKVTKAKEKGKLLNIKKAVNKLQVENEGKARDRKQKKIKK
jgi:regulator of ribosome biosynthesis